MCKKKVYLTLNSIPVSGLNSLPALTVSARFGSSSPSWSC